MKMHHPVEFGCGLLNNQPMGFYHPSVLVEDLKRHGLTALPVDVNLSGVRCLPERIETDFTSPLAGEVGGEAAGWGRAASSFTSPLAGEVGAEAAGWGRAAT